MKKRISHFLFLLCTVVFSQGCDHLSSPRSSSSSEENSIVPLEHFDKRMLPMGKVWGDISLLHKPQETVPPSVHAATLSLLSVFPLSIVNDRFIQTQWIVLKRYPSHRFKISVTLVPCSGIKLQGVHVSVAHETMEKNHWQLLPPSSALAWDIKKMIFRTVQKQKAG